MWVVKLLRPGRSTMTTESSILLIEDEQEIRRFLRNTLPAHGYRLYEAVSGSDGLAQAQARNPDLVLVDLGLPDMDGLDVIRKLREWTQAPIIVLSRPWTAAPTTT
jgi:two-component system KDP operon response regulator KdpE